MWKTHMTRHRDWAAVMQFRRHIGADRFQAILPYERARMPEDVEQILRHVHKGGERITRILDGINDRALQSSSPIQPERRVLGRNRSQYSLRLDHRSKDEPVAKACDIFMASRVAVCHE